MKYIDMHCDTLLRLFYKRRANPDLYDFKEANVDIKRLKDNVKCQFFAVYFPEDTLELNDYEYFLELKDYLVENTNKYDIGFAKNYEDILASDLSAMLTIEDARAVVGKLENIKKFYDNGVRSIGILWNHENCFGYPNSLDKEIMNKGLKPFGKEALEYMEYLGILLDVSHLNDGGFYDALDILKKPFVATHSNARSISNSPRNLTDDMLRKLGEKGGMTGINFAPYFLTQDLKNSNSKVEYLVNHIRHIVNISGIDSVGIGTDFDGMSGNLEIDSPDKMYLLYDALIKDGFSSSEIEKIFYKNSLRIIKEVIK